MFNLKWGLCTRVVAVCLLALGMGRDVGAQGLTKIADLNTPIPNGRGAFTSFTQPQVSFGNVIFAGSGTGNQRGIYRFDQSTGFISTVVDGNTPLPGSGFLSVGTESVFANDVSFKASGLEGVSVYTTRGGLREIVPPNVRNVGGPTSIDAQHISFGYNNSVTSVVGGFAEVNNSGVVKPGADAHKYLARDGATPFTTNDVNFGFRGVYLLFSSAGGFEFSDGAAPAVGPQAPSFRLPGETGGYVWAGGPPIFSDDGESVAFYAYGSSDAAQMNRTQTGIYTKTGTGPLRTVVNDDTVLPGRDGTSTFESLTNLSIDGRNIVFIGAPFGGPAGIFAASNGLLAEVVSVGDTLDGKTVSDLSFSGDRPLSGDDFVFTATFGDSSRGLYLTQVPEPAALCWMAGAATLLLTRVTRKRG